MYWLHGFGDEPRIRKKAADMVEQRLSGSASQQAN
jgi:hypothetical protein